MQDIVGQIVALRRVLASVEDPVERRRLAAVVRQLRRQLGVGVPKRRAAASLGVSVQALEALVRAGAVPTTRRPGSSRELIDSEALLALAEEVDRRRDSGRERVLAQAVRAVRDAGRMPSKVRPNQPAGELRHEYLHSTPAGRLQAGIALSETAHMLAANARSRSKATS
jgi:hypothetical protein